MMREVFAFLNTFLKTRTFLVGERLTLADVSLAADLLLAYRHVADEKFRKPYGNLNRWFLTVVNQESVSKVFGQVCCGFSCSLILGCCSSILISIN